MAVTRAPPSSAGPSLDAGMAPGRGLACQLADGTGAGYDEQRPGSHRWDQVNLGGVGIGVLQLVVDVELDVIRQRLRIALIAERRLQLVLHLLHCNLVACTAAPPRSTLASRPAMVTCPIRRLPGGNADHVAPPDSQSPWPLSKAVHQPGREVGVERAVRALQRRINGVGHQYAVTTIPSA